MSISKLEAQGERSKGKWLRLGGCRVQGVGCGV